jgi:hypothetical protein
MAKPKPVREGLCGGDSPILPSGPGLVGEEARPLKRKRGKPSKIKAALAKPPKKPRKPDPAVEAADIPPLDRPLNLHQENAVDEEGGDKDILDGLFAKAFDRWMKKEEADKGVSAIAKVVSFIQSGRSLKELEAELVPLLSEQASKSNLLQATMYNHQMERVALHWSSRWDLERSLWEDLREQKLTPREKIALLKLSTVEAKDAADYINKASGQFTPMTEVEPTIEKAGKHSASKALAEKKKEFEGTTPQGREIIRRFTFKAKQAAEKLVSAELDKEKKTDGGDK